MYRVKYTAEYVKQRITETAEKLTAQGVLSDEVVYMVMLNGGVWFASHLLDAITTPSNEIHYIKGHSYNGTTRGEMVWDYFPEMDLTSRHVVVLDDICDSGNTTNAIYNALKAKALSVEFVTLLKRSTCQLEDGVQVYSCIEDDSDDFFVGCGLDDNGHCRMLPYVGIVEKQ